MCSLFVFMCRRAIISLILVMLGCPRAMLADAPASAVPAKSQSIRKIKIEPEQITLLDGSDARRVLVLGETDPKTWIDLTSTATLQSDSPCIEIDPAGYLHAKAKGQATVTVSAGGKQAKFPVKVLDAAIPEIRFVRDVEPIMNKVGCNAGTCHGSAKGKNGFKLSLRGYDPDYDYQALVNDLSGRRINRVVVEQSLMLLKPTAEVPHEGRQAIKPGSREYQIVRDWIAQGARPEDASARANRVEILPAEVELGLPGLTQQILVIARYPDGQTRD